LVALEPALFGMIGILGARIWIDAKVDFTDSLNLLIAASALIIGISDMSGLLASTHLVALSMQL
jgi:NCS2 family nucleobase:cation symporter-2